MIGDPSLSGRLDEPNDAAGASAGQPSLPSIVCDLQKLIDRGAKFPTIYADPPWPYTNTAARGAAVNHYRTMTLEAVRNEPVKQLAADQAHLHLWTTNAFLREAFDVIRAWGFHYKSCLVWIKPQLGMGNYWRVSHEFLLLGVRGNLPFRDRTCRSWLLARRTAHSRKPFAFRELIERVSPAPYLELYGARNSPTQGGLSTATRLNGDCFERGTNHDPTNPKCACAAVRRRSPSSQVCQPCQLLARCCPARCKKQSD